MNALLAVSIVMFAGAPGSWTDAAQSYAQGPVAVDVDLRTMLTRQIVRRSCEALDATAARRRDAIANGTGAAWRDATRKAVRDALGPMPFGQQGGPLNIRAVSKVERPAFTVENVLFESLPGLDVNASIYLPRAEDFPPPWPAIVVPVGHDTKTAVVYQHPAQVFARRGYVAITFDPPAMAGEKQKGNDHFRDGVRCFLTGASSNRYFVIDALRCIDYLATRPDIDMRNGVGMTGVSGGGMTTMFATLLDDRIKASGPGCCAVPLALHPVLDGYAACPETLAFGRFAQYDDIDVLAAAFPTPVLLMAGARDEVFTADMSKRIASDVTASFEDKTKFDFFLDESGHAYTVAMAQCFADWMDKWVKGAPSKPAHDFKVEDLELLPREALMCNPRQETNMTSVNAALAAELRATRKEDPAAAARLLAGVGDTVRIPDAKCGSPNLVWFHNVQEIALMPEPGIALPTTFLYPAKENAKSGVLLYFDDRGRWTDLRTQGVLTRIARFTEKDAALLAVMSVDLRGFGDSKPADERYDLAGWGARERWIAYVSAGLGDSVMAMRIRDGLSALAYLRTRPEIDPSKIVIGGRGLGATIALHVAAIDGKVAGAFALDGLATFESLATSEQYAWSPEAFYPNVLAHYDLPELVRAMPLPVLMANPLDATKSALTADEANHLYAPKTTAMSSAEIVTFTQAILSKKS